jgi:integral membrane protein
VKGSFQRFRVMAYVTGVVLATATIWALIGYLFLDYGAEGGKPGIYSVLWIAHGWLYFIYLITAVDLSFRMRYSLLRTLGILIAGTVPFMSFVAEHYVRKDVIARRVLDS